MKKLTILLVAVITSFTFILSGCWWNKKTDVIRVNEVTHSVFYAPLYIAMNKGYFKDEKITIELTNGGGADKSMTALITNSADIGLMGPEAAVYVNNEGLANAPKVFAQLTKRDGSFLMARNQNANFKWSDLEGKEIIAGRKGGAPYMSLEYALNQNGLYDGQNVALISNVEFNSTIAAFEGNVGDYVTAFEPSASNLENINKGYIVASVGAMSGEIPFTAFMARENYLNKNKDKVKGFLRAINRAYIYLTTADIDDVVDAIYPSFKDTTSKELVKKSLHNYIKIDAWVSTPVMQDYAYTNLINMLKNSGELSTDVAMNKVVDNTIAKELMLETIK